MKTPKYIYTKSDITKAKKQVNAQAAMKIVTAALNIINNYGGTEIKNYSENDLLKKARNCGISTARVVKKIIDCDFITIRKIPRE